MDDEKLRELIERWKRIARKKFLDAGGESDAPVVSGKRFVNHGATCYANCAGELERMLAATTDGMVIDDYSNAGSPNSPLEMPVAIFDDTPQAVVDTLKAAFEAFGAPKIIDKRTAADALTE